MTDLPSGTVTFLFTDIEDSTKLWEQHPGAMKSALANHDAVLKDAINSNKRYIIKGPDDGIGLRSVNPYWEFSGEQQGA